MKYYIIAGEASGDLHASNMMKALLDYDQDAVFRVWGGDLMENAGGQLVKHYRDLAFMGFVEVVQNLKTILGNIKFCKKDILEFEPDALILVDYPGFNLRIAKWAKRKGIRIIYYISPQIWAWNSKRVHAIKRDIDQMLVILPFEKAFYKSYGMDVDFVGHPLLDVIKNRTPNHSFRQQHQLSDKPVIALLPGSRKQEISKMLKGMLALVDHFKDFEFVIAGAPGIDLDFYTQILDKQNLSLPIIQNKTYDLLTIAKAALVTSGTATLETGLFGVPQVVCYKGSTLSYWIARQLVNVKYISLVNLILDRPLVEELIQNDFNQKNLIAALEACIQRPEKLLQGYEELAAKLGNEGASQKAAASIWKHLSK